jgi:hypothetical protein
MQAQPAALATKEKPAIPAIPSLSFRLTRSALGQAVSKEFF